MVTLTITDRLNAGLMLYRQRTAIRLSSSQQNACHVNYVGVAISFSSKNA